jgi:hypothetical protein
MRTAGVVLLVTAAVACADPYPTEVETSPTSHALQESDLEITDNPDSEFDWYGPLYMEIHTEGRIRGREYDGIAKTTVRDGTVAEATARLTVHYGTARYDEQEFRERDYLEGIGLRVAVARPHYQVGKDCGYTFRQNSSHLGQRIKTTKVWTSSGPRVIEEKTAERIGTGEPITAPQPECTPPPPPSGGGDECEIAPQGKSVAAGTCDSGVTCGWHEYGLFVQYDGVWYLVGDTWWEYECEQHARTARGEPGDRARVMVLLVPDAAFSGAPAHSTLRRSNSRSAPHLIMLRESAATAQELSIAYKGLLAWLRRDPEGRGTAHLGPVQISLTKPPEAYSWARGTIENLRNSPYTDVPGVGRVRSITLELQ